MKPGTGMKPEVSVIIPVYNSEAYIGEAIESVLRQTFRDFEIIVVDDGSDDRSAEIAASYPGVRLFRRSHEGVAAARNYGIMEAGADLVSFLDADDLYSHDKLELQAGYLAEHSECGVVFSEYRNFSDIPENEMNERQKALMQVHVKQCLPAACIRKEIFKKYGLFDTSYPYGEDTEFFMRLGINRVDFSHRIEKVLYLRRVHGNNITVQHELTRYRDLYAILTDAVRKRRKGSAAANPEEKK